LNRRYFFALIGSGAALLLLFTGIFLVGSMGVALESEEPVLVEVRSGEGLNQFLRRVEKEGLVKQTGWIRLLAIVGGDSRSIKAGEYAFKGSVSFNEFIDTLVSGKARHIALTIPEGWSLKEIAKQIEEKELGSPEEFLSLTMNQEFIAKLELPFSKLRTLEGLIFPETYFFNRGLPMEKIISSLVREIRTTVYQELEKSAGKIGMTPYQVMVLASVIEKETGLASERRTISAVFHNRLKSGMRLDSDPTVIYGIKDFNGNLTRKDLRTYTEYNTYKIYGLPPTPIASPGLDAIRAAMDPEPVKYLFFVGKGDGSHFFSKDLKTHNRAVWRYQKLPARKKRS